LKQLLSAMCYGDTVLDEAVTLIFNLCCIIIAIYLGILFAKHHSTEHTEAMLPYKIIFLTATAGTVLAMVCSMIHIIVCPYADERISYPFLAIGTTAGLSILFSSLFIAFIFRLYATFKGTVWKISKLTLIAFIIFILILCGINLTAGFLINFGVINKGAFWGIQCSTLTAYIAASTYPVYRFVRNLIALAKMRSIAASQRDLSAESGVTEKQQDLINLSSKYVLLFTVAVSTTILNGMSNAISRVFSSDPIHPGMVQSIDSAVNLWCLYLYHHCASPQYDRYCSRFARCFAGGIQNSIKMENRLSIDQRATERTQTTQTTSGETATSASEVNVDNMIIVYGDEPSASPSPSPKSPSSPSEPDIVFKS